MLSCNFIYCFIERILLLRFLQEYYSYVEELNVIRVEQMVIGISDCESSVGRHASSIDDMRWLQSGRDAQNSQDFYFKF